MQRLSLRSLHILVLALIVSASLFAANGRNFAGVFNIRNVNASSGTVTFTLDVQLQNHSGSQVADATVNLQDRFSAQSYGTFPSVQIANPGLTNLSGSFTIPSREFALWQKGVTPSLGITYRDASGQTVREQITVTRHTLVGVK